MGVYALGIPAGSLIALTVGGVLSDVRATASAVQSSVVLLIGLGLGPVAVGAASDALSGSGLGAAEGIRWALMGTSLVCIVAALFFTIAARAMKATKLS